MRQGEQYILTGEHVDLERRLITIPRSKHDGIRHVELNDAAVAALLQAHALGNGSEHVFLNCYGQRLSKPREWFEASVKKAGIQGFTWHCLRHTLASRLIMAGVVMAGVDLRTVQELMGHKTIQMTCRYAPLAPQHRLAAVQRLCDTEMVANEGATKTATAAFSSEMECSKATTSRLNRCTCSAAPGWRNWQTQRTQNPPRATSWGFDPPSRHQDKTHKMNSLQRPKPLSPRGFFMPKSAGDTSGDTLLFWFRRDRLCRENGKR
jgi:hypothetical protein